MQVLNGTDLKDQALDMTLRWIQGSPPDVLKKSNHFSLPVLLQRCFMQKMVKEKEIQKITRNWRCHIFEYNFFFRFHSTWKISFIAL